MPKPSCRHPPYTPTELLGTGCLKSEPIISRGSWNIVCRLSNNVANPCTPQACLQPPALAYNRTGGTRPLCLPLKPDERCGDAVYARISESGLPRPGAPLQAAYSLDSYEPAPAVREHDGHLLDRRNAAAALLRIRRLYGAPRRTCYMAGMNMQTFCSVLSRIRCKSKLVYRSLIFVDNKLALHTHTHTPV